jgi:hypothetical protein
VIRLLSGLLTLSVLAVTLALSGAPAQAADITCGFTLNLGETADIDLDGPSCAFDTFTQELVVFNDTDSSNGITFVVDSGVTGVNFTGTFATPVDDSQPGFYDVPCLTANACNFNFNATYGGQPVTLNVIKPAGSNVVSFGAGSIGSDPEINIQGNGISIADGDTTPSVTDDTDFGDVLVAGGTNPNTFTIQNTGTSDLTLTSVSSSDNTQFAVSGTTSGTIAAAGSATFTVTFDPTSTGTQTATITVVSDDADEGTYTFDVEGNGTAPEINIQGNGVSIADGDTTPSATDDTDFGDVLVAGGSNANTFTIQNTGTGNLTLTSVTSSDNTQFAVSGTTSGTIAAAGSSTFTVTFDPTSTGTQTATITVVSSDADEGTYTFDIEGNGTAPEINIQGNGVSIADGDTTPSVTDDTDFGDVAVAGGTNPNTFTIQNTGTGNLTLTSVTSSDNTQFAVSGTTSGTIAAAGSSTFTVTFDPTSTGTQTATITVVSDDADEGTYTFDIEGNGTSVPGFAQAFSPSTILKDGTSTVTFTIDNSANASAATSLDFTDNLPAGVSVASPANASTTCTGGTLTATSGAGTISYTGGTVGAGATCTVSADVTSATDGAYSNTTGDLTSSLGNSGTSNATLTVASPEIDVQRPAATTIADGGTDAQGSVAAAVQQSLTYTIENAGNATLTISATPTSSAASNVTIDNITAPGSLSLAGAATTTFTVLYTPTVAGAFSFELDIVSDDADEATYDILVSGTATGNAEISVTSSASGAVADGGTDTVPGTVSAGSASVITYTITNSGTDTLTLSPPTVGGNVSGASNVTVNGFTLSSTTVAAGGGTQTLQVSYTPTAAGGFGFDLSIANDDADENPYNIAVSGTATGAPEIAVSSSEGGAVSDGGTDTVGSTPSPGTAATITYTITNSGTDTLSVTAPTVAGNVSGASNVTVNSLTLGATTVASVGGTTTLVVNYTATAAGAFSFALSLANDDGDENPFNVTVSGTAASPASTLAATSGSGQSTEVGTQFGAVLVATVTDGSSNGVAGVDVTFTAPATGASLTFAGTGTNTETVTTGADGTATSSAMTANATASSYDGGGSLTPYSVTASASGLTSVTFSLTNDRDSEADIQKTKEVIASFVTSRANAIVAGQPDLVSRLTGGPFGRQSGRNGFNFNVTPYAQSGSFQFSLRAFANAMRKDRSDRPAAGDGGAISSQGTANPERYAVFDSFSSSGTMSYTAVAPQLAGEDTLAILSGSDATATNDAAQDGGALSGWDFWAQGTYAVTRNNDSDSQTGLFFAGLDYRYRDRAVFGLMGQLDVTDESNDSANTSSDGVGWMAGPYAVVRVHQNFYLDGVMTYGQSYNSVNALGLFEDDFRTQRFLLQGGLTGDFRLNETTRISPFTRITYYYEEQQSYTDTLGRIIPSQDFDLGRLEFGPKVSFDLILDDRLLFSPFLSLSGIYDFNKLQDTTPTDATLASSDEDLRARLEAGAGLLIPGRNIQISGEGFYDGIGTADFHSYGATLNVRIPF